MSEYLKKIDSPADLKALPEEAMGPLAAEIRQFLIENVTVTGGHLASNLGIVELTLALERALDLPKDHLIFDVGHQCYVHKLLTGRRERFPELRRIGGLSGFTRRSESEYDCFGAGHSSTSLSAAIGFAEAERIRGSDAYTVAVIGDGAFTGGMIHEALNNCRRDLRLIIVLNENEMSISKNIGTFATALARLRSSREYYKTKNVTTRALRKIPLIGGPLFRGIRKVKQTVKNVFYGSNYFESLGLYYLGPADGNDFSKVSILLNEAMDYGKSCVIHLKTRKGMGCESAMKEPAKYHSVPPAASTASAGDNYSAAFGRLLCSLASENDRVCAVTAAMTEGTGLTDFRRTYPDRFFDVGIAEEHALTFSAGLAANGMRPFFAVYSSFLQRGYDNLIHDIALQRLPVTVCIDRAGLSAADGATHHGVFDAAFLSAIPGFRLYAPSSFDSLEWALRLASAGDCPCAIRYPNRGEVPGLADAFGTSDERLSARADYPVGERDKKKLVMITYGPLVGNVLAAEKALGPDVGVILLESLLPIRESAEDVRRLLPAGVPVLFAEEGVRAGGIGMSLKEALGCGRDFGVLAVEDPFTVRRVSADVCDAYGIGTGDILAAAKELLSGKNGSGGN